MEDLQNINNSVKQPPSAVDVERAILGAMILDDKAIPKVIESLQPESFFDKKIIQKNQKKLVFRDCPRIFHRETTYLRIPDT